MTHCTDGSSDSRDKYFVQKIISTEAKVSRTKLNMTICMCYILQTGLCTVCILFFIVLKPDCSYIIPTSTKYPFNWGVSNSAAGFLHCCLCQFKTKIAQPWSPPSPCHAFPSSQPSSSAFPLNPPLCLPVPSFNEGIGVLAVIGLITATCYR